MSRPWRIVARPSPLSRRQAEEAEGALRDAFPGRGVERREVLSHGDRDQNLPFRDMGIQGIFEKEVNREVVEGRADLAVHSLKDLPMELPEPLSIVAVLPRGPPGDLLVGPTVPSVWDGLAQGTRVGTTSVRRQALVRFHAPQCTVLPVRGNVGTRLEKLQRGEFDALLLAEAGIRRLGLPAAGTPLDPHIAVPAPGQGTIALVGCRSLEEPLQRLRQRAATTWREIQVERAAFARMGSGCSMASGAFAETAPDGRIHLYVAEWKPDGSARRRSHLILEPEDDPSVARAAMNELSRAPWEPRSGRGAE